MARGSIQVRHRKRCPATGKEARQCRCSPTVYAVVAGQFEKIGYLPGGWRKSELVPFERRLAEMRESFEAGQSWRPRKPLSLAEYAEGWFDELYAAALDGRISKLTHDHYEGAYHNHIEPRFGHLPLAAIDQAAIRKFISDKLGAGMKLGSVKYIGAVLSAMLTDAAAAGLIVANPARQPRMPRHGGSRRKALYADAAPSVPKFLEPTEARALIAAAEPKHRLMVLAALTTGARCGELYGLRWEDIRWGERRIWIGGQLQRREYVRCKYGSEREVVLYSGLAGELGKHRHAEGYIFTDDDGRPFGRREPDRMILGPAYERAGLRRPGQMWHLLRHTYCSILANGGIRREVIERLMGHSPRGSTTTIYTHLFKDAFDGVEEVLDAVFGVNDTSTDCSVSTDNHRTHGDRENSGGPLDERETGDVAVSGGVR
jgi:integrase